jgi:TonB family protein
MNQLYTILTFIVAALHMHAGAYAQARKAQPPVDTGVLERLPVPLETRPAVMPLPSQGFFCPIERQPEFPGGTRAMYKFIEANLRIPSMAREVGISGRVFTTFTIEITGEITNVTVLKGLGFGCDEEAIRLVQSMPRWKPAKRSDKVVKVKYNLPISFATKE